MGLVDQLILGGLSGTEQTGRDRIKRSQDLEDQAYKQAQEERLHARGLAEQTKEQNRQIDPSVLDRFGAPAQQPQLPQDRPPRPEDFGLEPDYVPNQPQGPQGLTAPFLGQMYSPQQTQLPSGYGVTAPNPMQGHKSGWSQLAPGQYEGMGEDLPGHPVGEQRRLLRQQQPPPGPPMPQGQPPQQARIFPDRLTAQQLQDAQHVVLVQEKLAQLQHQRITDHLAARKVEEDAAQLQADRRSMERAQKLEPGTLDGVSADRIKGLQAGMTMEQRIAQIRDDKRVSRDFQATQNAIGRRQALDIHNDSMAQAAERAGTARQAKLTEKRNAAEVTGWELPPGAPPPREADVSKLRDAGADYMTMTQNLRDVQELYNRYGTEVLPTEARAAMTSLVNSLRMSAKNKAMYDLGVLNGRDFELISKSIPDPTNPKSSVLDFFSGDKDIATKFKTLGLDMTRRYENKHKAFGYRKAEAKAPPIVDANGDILELEE